MRTDPFDIYGDYADYYCEPAAPSAMPHFYHPSGSVTFSRLPVYPEYELRWEQALVTTGGADTYAYAPIAQELLIKLQWPRMPKVNKEGLEYFFKTVAKGASERWTYSNNFIGPALPVRFASDTLAAMPEVAYQQYQVSLMLRVALNYPQMTASGAAPAIAGNRFVIGSVAWPFPVPVKGTGHGLQKLQAAGRDSAGDQVIYDKSRILRVPHQLDIRHTYADFIGLQAFFFTFVHGCERQFTWVDQDGASKNVRLSTPSITVKQVGYDRFETTLNLLEEIPA